MGRVLLPDGGTIGQAAAVDALAESPSIRTVAALHWLLKAGEASCMAPIARLCQTPQVPELTRSLAKRVLHALEKRYGVIEAGGLSLTGGMSSAGALTLNESDSSRQPIRTGELSQAKVSF